MADRPFITCHVLDTITGKPGANIKVSLRLVDPSQLGAGIWTATTNEDGRVTAWKSSQSHDLNKFVAQAKSLATSGIRVELQTTWSLTFDTEAYFGKGKTFWPEITLTFACKMDEEHYHVPLLLGPWSYTTYRGS